MLLEEFASSYQEGLAYAQSVLDELVDEWGLELTLTPNGQLKSTLGYYYHGSDNIVIATYAIIDRPGAVILDVVRHEFAHALDYKLHGTTDHSPRWREVALACGARPRANGTTEQRVEYHYMAATREST